MTGQKHRWSHKDWDSTHETCTGSRQTKSQHSKGEIDIKCHQNSEAVCSWYLVDRENSVFSNGVSLGKAVTSRVDPMAGGVSQHKTASIWSGFVGALFVWGFWVLVFVLLFGCLFVLLIFFMLACLPVLTFKFWLCFSCFYCCCFGREHESFVGGEVGRTWQDLRRQKNMIKIIV